MIKMLMRSDQLLQCHFLQTPGILILLQYIKSQIIRQCIQTVVLLVPCVCMCMYKCFRTPPYYHGVDVHVGNVSYVQ